MVAPLKSAYGMIVRRATAESFGFAEAAGGRQEYRR